MNLRRNDRRCRGDWRRRVAAGFAVMEHGQRIARVDLCSCATPACALGRSGSRCRTIEEQPAVAGLCAANQRRDIVLDEARVNTIRDELGMLQQALQKSDVGRHAFDPEFAQRAIGLRHHVGEVGRVRMRNELGEQRIEAWAGRVSGVGERIDAHARSRWRLERGDRPAGRLRAAIGAHRFHVDSHLHREAARLGNIGLLHPEFRERASARQLNLQLDEIDARNFFRDRVLDLEPRVGLDEGKAGLVVFRGRIGVDEEFEGAEIVVAHLLRHPHCSCRQADRAWRARVPGSARSRRSSGCGAGYCIRAPTGG